jgi:chromate transporter
MNDDGPILPLFLYLVLISLIAVGGINGALPDLHRFIVDENGWLTDRQFTAYFALAQAAPGPNFLFATVIGWHVAGLGGALLATFAVCGPTSLIAFVAAYAMRSHYDTPVFRMVRRSLVPVTLGLVAASGYFLTQASATSWQSYVVTAAATAVLLVTRINPLWVLAAGGVLGVTGLV